MCSAPSMPEMPKMQPLPEMPPMPEPKPLPTPQQAPPAPSMPPQAPVQPAPSAPLPPPLPLQDQQAPPPQMVQNGNSAEDTAIVKRRKSKRQELQQASGGTDALRIDLNKSIGAAPTGSTGSTGLNIPR